MRVSSLERIEAGGGELIDPIKGFRIAKKIVSLEKQIDKEVRKLINTHKGTSLINYA
jgi:hypothetical protein